jgi:pyrimidine-nucleoside phosphorylase
MLDLRDLIALKRDGGELSADQIATFVRAAAEGSAPEVQLASMLMAVFCRGMNDRERTDYALAMMRSGEVLSWEHLERPTMDKHSTGGVGDKISLIWAPLVMACGFAVPMISGRGLGHTGGTLDKLDTIPGFRTDLSAQEMDAVIRRAHGVITGQTAALVPSDRTLYALRSRTATVPTLDHIAPSILSKKLAEGAATLVLDVKVGTGAFMKTLDDARALAATMLAIGRGAGRNMAALISSMSAPLGRAVGNAIEVEESVAVLKGARGELRELTLALATDAIAAAGQRVDSPGLEQALDSGAAMTAFEAMVEAQGGDVASLHDPARLLGAGDVREIVLGAPRSGVIGGLDALGVGLAVAALGGGRGGDGEAPHPGVGAWIEAQPGDAVQAGDPLVRLRHADAGLDEAKARYLGAIAWADEPSPPAAIVLERCR